MNKKLNNSLSKQVHSYTFVKNVKFISHDSSKKDTQYDTAYIEKCVFKSMKMGG